MSNHKQPYRHLTEDQLRKYLRGELKGKEANEVERLMLDSPLEADAMEGWEAFDEADLGQDLSLLRERLEAKRNTSRFPWLRIAASIAVLFTLGISIWLITSQPSDKEYLAEKSTIEKSDEDPVADPSPKAEINDENFEEEAMFDKADSKGEIVVNEEKPVVQQPVIAEKKEQEESVTTEIQTTEEVLAELIFEEEDDFVADVAEEPVEIDEAKITTESVPELPTEVPVRVAKSVAKQYYQEGTGISDSKRAESPPSTSDAVSRSVAISPRVITGFVVDEMEQAGIPGVNVIEKGTTNGATTDLDGHYSITLTGTNSTLVYSFVGFEAQEIVVGSRTVIDVQMSSDVSSLSEVVVTGYGVQGGGITDVDPSYKYESAYPTEGRGAYKDYIEQNLQYPAEALSNAVSGTVKLKATILSNGLIGEIEVLRGLGYGCDEEAIRLVREGPEWTPAVRNGEQITSEVSIKIRFKLP